MKRGPILLVLMCLLLLGATGCSRRYKVHIESNTCWDGLFNNEQGVYGCGNSTYKVIGKLGCVRVQKNTTMGYLRVRIENQPWAETADSFGVVQVCN